MKNTREFYAMCTHPCDNTDCPHSKAHAYDEETCHSGSSCSIVVTEDGGKTFNFHKMVD
jgi:hypothetical protein